MSGIAVSMGISQEWLVVDGDDIEELRTVSDRMIYVVGSQISDRWFY